MQQIVIPSVLLVVACSSSSNDMPAGGGAAIVGEGTGSVHVMIDRGASNATHDELVSDGDANAAIATPQELTFTAYANGQLRRMLHMQIHEPPHAGTYAAVGPSGAFGANTAYFALVDTDAANALYTWYAERGTVELTIDGDVVSIALADVTFVPRVAKPGEPAEPATGTIVADATATFTLAPK